MTTTMKMKMKNMMIGTALLGAFAGVGPSAAQPAAQPTVRYARTSQQPRCGKSAAAQKAKRIRKIARHSRVRNKGSNRG